MSRNIIFVLMYHRHKLLDLINTLFFGSGLVMRFFFQLFCDLRKTFTRCWNSTQSMSCTWMCSQRDYSILLRRLRCALNQSASLWREARQCGRVVMAWSVGWCEWLRVVLIAVGAVNVLGQVSHVDPVGYTSHEGTRCYDDAGRPQVPCSFVVFVNMKP
jgi:hypothetical protein